MLTRNRVWLSPVPFLAPLETCRGRTLMSRRRAAWKRSMEGLAVKQSAQWFLEEGIIGEHTPVTLLHFLSWSSPDRVHPWESSGERALSTCSQHFITSPHNCKRKQTQLVQDAADTLSAGRSRGICYWGEQRGGHTKALVKTLKVSVSWNTKGIIPLTWAPNNPPRTMGLPSLKFWSSIRTRMQPIWESEINLLVSLSS